jgi:hypothetical protein
MKVLLYMRDLHIYPVGFPHMTMGFRHRATVLLTALNTMRNSIGVQ